MIPPTADPLSPTEEKNLGLEQVEDVDPSLTKSELLMPQQLSLSKARTVRQTLKEDRKAMLVICAALVSLEGVVP
jgi:hypothetical protein